MVTSLRSFYFLRAGVAYAWVAAVVVTHPGRAPLAAAALAVYAGWDALANVIDVRRNPLPGDSTRQINTAVSLAAAAVMAAGAVSGFNLSVVAFGAWAILAGVLQLVVGLRRRSAAKGQVLMMLSGGQSAVAGFFFARGGVLGSPTIADVYPYAAFGASYFLASAAWLAWSDRRTVIART